MHRNKQYLVFQAFLKHLFVILVMISGLNGFTVFAQDFSGTTICINPGHGGHDADDRYISETGFWESEGNLTKGLALRDILQQWGAEVVMTRTANTSEDDLPLSQISTIANEHGADFFLSIHSNAYNGKINYPLMLFRGYDDEPVFPAAKEMSSLMWQQLNGHGRGYWKYSWENVRGDWSFYPDWGTQGLGVLRNLQMPGVLSEGSFHDYIPESWRLMNVDYRAFEAWLFARSFLDFSAASYPDMGIVQGLVRDAQEEVHTYYSIDQVNDHMQPVNGISIRLQDTEHTYQGDSLQNGFFMLDSVPPGTYTLIASAPGYPTDEIEVVVESGSIYRADINLHKENSAALRKQHPAGRKNLRVYPQPAADYVYFDLPEQAGGGRLEIFSPTGKRQLSKQLGAGLQRWQFYIPSGWTPGVYAWRLATSKGLYTGTLLVH